MSLLVRNVTRLLLSSFGWLDYDTVGISIAGSFSIISLIIIIIYILSIKSMNAEESTNDDGVSDLSYKKIAIMFTLWSLVVFGSSYFVTIVVDNIGTQLDLESSFAGAIFLGVATSLPELTAVITLMKLKNYEAALGNIIGSNVFNLTIISVVDFINYKEDLYTVLVTDPELRKNISLLLILGLINSIILMIALLRKKSLGIYTYIIPSVLILISYLAYIGLSLYL